MQYFIRFVGDIVPHLGVNLPAQVFEGVFVNADTEEQLVDFVNNYSLQLLQRGGLVVFKEDNIPARSPEERKASPMPRPKTAKVAFDKKMIIPMHMISNIHPEVLLVQPPQPVKPLLPELAVFEPGEGEEGPSKVTLQ